MASLREAEKFHIYGKLQSFHESLPFDCKDEDGVAPVSDLASDIRNITSSEENLRREEWLHDQLRSLNLRRDYPQQKSVET